MICWEKGERRREEQGEESEPGKEARPSPQGLIKTSFSLHNKTGAERGSGREMTGEARVREGRGGDDRGKGKGVLGI